MVSQGIIQLKKKSKTVTLYVNGNAFPNRLGVNLKKFLIDLGGKPKEYRKFLNNFDKVKWVNEESVVSEDVHEYLSDDVNLEFSETYMMSNKPSYYWAFRLYQGAEFLELIYNGCKYIPVTDPSMDHDYVYYIDLDKMFMTITGGSRKYMPVIFNTEVLLKKSTTSKKSSGSKTATSKKSSGAKKSSGSRRN